MSTQGFFEPGRIKQGCGSNHTLHRLHLAHKGSERVHSQKALREENPDAGGLGGNGASRDDLSDDLTRLPGQDGPARTVIIET